MTTSFVDRLELPNGVVARALLGRDVPSAQRDEMVALMTRAFGAWPNYEVGSPREHLDWKLEGPFPELPTVSTHIELDGRIVSMGVSMRRRMLARGRELVFSAGGDTSTDPNDQNKGYRSARRDFRQDHVDLGLQGGLSFSRNPVVMRGRRNRGNRAPANAPRVLVRVFNAFALARSDVHGVIPLPVPAQIALLAPLQLAGVGLTLRRSRPAPSLRLVEVTRFDERFDDLFDDAATQFELIGVRSAGYLNWRYADPRGGRYVTLAAVEGERVIGYLAFRISRRRGYLVDLLARPGRLDAVRALVGETERRFRAASVTSATCWLPRRHPYYRTLLRGGYIEVPVSTGSSYREREAAPPGSLAFLDNPRARNHITLGDSDWS